MADILYTSVSGEQNTLPVVDVAASVTLTVQRLHQVDTSGAAFIVTLPTGATDGQIVAIADVKGAFPLNNLSVSPGLGDTIDGAAGQVLETAYGIWEFVYDATENLWNMTKAGASGENRVHADDTTVAPATVGLPTLAEIQAFVTANGTTNTSYYYTGDDLPASAPTHVYVVDDAGTATLVYEPSAGLDTIRVDASGAAQNLTLPAANGTNDTVVYTLLDKTNAADITVQPGENLNGALNATFNLDAYDVGTQFLATDRGAGNWDISVIGAPNQVVLHNAEYFPGNFSKPSSGATTGTEDLTGSTFTIPDAGKFDINVQSNVAANGYFHVDGRIKLRLIDVTAGNTEIADGEWEIDDDGGAGGSNPNSKGVINFKHTATLAASNDYKVEVNWARGGGTASGTGNNTSLSAQDNVITVREVPSSESVLAGMIKAEVLHHWSVWHNGNTAKTGNKLLLNAPTNEIDNETLRSGGDITIKQDGFYRLDLSARNDTWAASSNISIRVDGVVVADSDSQIQTGNLAGSLGCFTFANLTDGQVVTFESTVATVNGISASVSQQPVSTVVDPGMVQVSNLVGFTLEDHTAAYNTSIDSTTENSTTPYVAFAGDSLYDQWLGATTVRASADVTTNADNLVVNKDGNYEINLNSTLENDTGDVTRHIQLLVNDVPVRATSEDEVGADEIGSLNLVWKGALATGDNVKVRYAATAGTTSVNSISIDIDELLTASVADTTPLAVSKPHRFYAGRGAGGNTSIDGIQPISAFPIVDDPNGLLVGDTIVISRDGDYRLEMFASRGQQGSSAHALAEIKVNGTTLAIAREGDYESSNTSHNWGNSGQTFIEMALTAGDVITFFSDGNTERGMGCSVRQLPYTTLAGTVTVLDEDNMATDSDTQVPTQQSVKAYVDGQLLGDHGDVDTTTTAPANGDSLVWDGTNWVPSAPTSLSNAYFYGVENNTIVVAGTALLNGIDVLDDATGMRDIATAGNHHLNITEAGVYKVEFKANCYVQNPTAAVLPFGILMQAQRNSGAGGAVDTIAGNIYGGEVAVGGGAQQGVSIGHGLFTCVAGDEIRFQFAGPGLNSQVRGFAIIVEKIR